MLGADLAGRIRRDVDRHVLRARNGIKHASGTSFVRVGATPHDVVWSRDGVSLVRYRSERRTAAHPVVLVPSIINRSYIFDLHPGNSFVEALLDLGIDVLLVDWGEAGPADAERTLETYVDVYLPAVMSAARAETGAATVHMIGYCLGGLLGLLYAAGRDDPGLETLVVLGVPVDFDKMGLLVSMVRDGRLHVDHVLDEDGNVPGDVIRRVIEMRRPTGSLVTYANLLDNLWNDAYVAGYQAMSRWVRETVPVPGRLARQIVDRLVRDNELMTGSLRLSGRMVELRAIGVPCLSVVAEFDDMVPLTAAAPLVDLVGQDRIEELRLPAGHIALVVGRRAMTKTIPQVVGWMSGASRTAAETSTT